MSARTPEGVHELMEAAFNRGDIDAFVEIFEPDATMITPPSGFEARGHDEIRRAAAPLFAMSPQMDIEMVGKLEADGLAMTHARWYLAGVDKERGLVELDGRGTIVSREQPDGTWRIVLDNPLSPG